VPGADGEFDEARGGGWGRGRPVCELWVQGVCEQ
jgi:hypothetical protein